MTASGAAGQSVAGQSPSLDTSPQALRDLLNGYRRTQMLFVAAKLGIPDLLKDAPRHSADLAGPLGVHPQALHRVLRGLALLAVLTEEPDGRFGLGPFGRHLLSDAPGSMRAEAILYGAEFYPAWGSLLYSVETGKPASHRVFGTSTWEHRAQDPDLNEHFNRYMVAMTTQVVDAVLAAYDFSSIHTLVDVGGGHGTLIAAVLQAHPHMAGILFDQDHVAAGARAYLEAAGVASRCRIVTGNFFEGVPRGADAYLLKWIIHDWDDDRSVAILKHCRAALEGRGKVLLVERLMPARAAQSPSTIHGDLTMLVIEGGRERTEAEFRALFTASGLALARIVPTRSDLYVIEAVPGDAEPPSNLAGAEPAPLGPSGPRGWPP
jgi:hypothetical protein